MVQILDPTDERLPIQRTLAPRPEGLHGAIGLLDISKPGSDLFLDRVEELLKQRDPSLVVRRYRKPTMAKMAPLETRLQMKEECDFVIEALAD